MKKRLLRIMAFVVITAIIIAVCAVYISNGQPSEYDGTLVMEWSTNPPA